MNQPIKWGYLPQNAGRLATAPNVKKREIEVPSPAELQSRVALAASSENPEMATIIEFAAITGMCRGEIGALRWSDVDTAARLTYVRCSHLRAGSHHDLT
ncbi:MAG: hypothetical protein ACLP62_01010 [Acidimicrobiales bacterium]